MSSIEYEAALIRIRAGATLSAGAGFPDSKIRTAPALRVALALVRMRAASYSIEFRVPPFG